MALNPLTLEATILTFTASTPAIPATPETPAVPAVPPPAGWPADNEEIAENWATALDAYFTEAVNPPLIPGVTIAAAHEAFCSPELGMPSVLDVDPMAGLAALEVGLALYASAVAFTAPTSVPPAAPPIWPALPFTDDPAIPAAAIAAAIDLWARTGFGPNPPAAPWS